MGVPLVAGVVTRSLAAVKSGVTRESLALENVNHPLRNIEQRRGGRLGDAEMGDQPARGTAMGGDHRVGRQALVPLSDARRHHLVALAARRHEMPFVVLALSDVLWVAHVQLRDGKALPFAEGDFREPRLAPETLRAKTERRARQFHGLAGARERARYIVEAGGIAIVTREQVAQDFTAMAALRAAARIERDVAAALQAAGNVPVGLAVADVIDGRPRHCRDRHYSTVKSGASGCLMPTM